MKERAGKVIISRRGLHKKRRRVHELPEELDRLLERLKSEERVPRLLLHSCCAPCSSYVLEYLNRYFEITVFYYNPNIYPESEYTKRIWEQQELISRCPSCTRCPSWQALMIRSGSMRWPGDWSM